MPTPMPGPLALRLGYAGLAPFIGGVLFIWLLAGRIAAEPFVFVVGTLTSYAALVTAFVGGLPWGLAMCRPDQDEAPTRQALWAGSACVLAAWVAMNMQPHAGLIVLGTLLIVSYLGDRKLYPRLGAEQWLTLRFRLSGVASLCCFLAAAQL